MPCCGAMVSNLVSQIICITGNCIFTRCLATCEFSIIVIGAKKNGIGDSSSNLD